MTWEWLLAMLAFAGTPTEDSAPDAAPAPVSADVVEPAVMRVGWIGNADYPRDARLAGEEGTVLMRYVVGADGKVVSCEIVASSHSVALDRKSCEIMTKRFRFRPARDAAGVKVPETREQLIAWRLSGPCPALESMDICVRPGAR